METRLIFFLIDVTIVDFYIYNLSGEILLPKRLLLVSLASSF